MCSPSAPQAIIIMNRVSTIRRRRRLGYIYAQLIIMARLCVAVVGGWLCDREERRGLRREHVCGSVLHLSCIIFDVDIIASVAQQFTVRGFYKDKKRIKPAS